MMALAKKQKEFNEAQKAASFMELANLLLKQLETCQNQVNEAKSPKARAKAEKKLLETKRMIAEGGILDARHHHTFQSTYSDDEFHGISLFL